jgi:hypothetical protein
MRSKVGAIPLRRDRLCALAATQEISCRDRALPSRIVNTGLMQIISLDVPVGFGGPHSTRSLSVYGPSRCILGQHIWGSKTMNKLALFGATVVLGALTFSSAHAATFFQGFETDVSGWDAFGGSYDAARVPSGTNGVTSASGGFHAESSVGSGSAGNWGGYGGGVFQPYTTKVDIFLDVGAGFANDTRFDFSSAINNSAGTHLRDFVFNAGFYDDATGPGGGSDRFVVSAGNNSGRANSYPKNVGSIAILTTGWYTFQHEFTESLGLLSVVMSILDSSNSLINSWTLGGDPIAGVGGNRYGWFVNNELSTLAFDNTQLNSVAVPLPAALPLYGAGLAVMGFVGWRRRRTVAAVAA